MADKMAGIMPCAFLIILMALLKVTAKTTEAIPTTSSMLLNDTDGNRTKPTKSVEDTDNSTMSTDNNSTMSLDNNSTMSPDNKSTMSPDNKGGGETPKPSHNDDAGSASNEEETNKSELTSDDDTPTTSGGQSPEVMHTEPQSTKFARSSSVTEGKNSNGPTKPTKPGSEALVKAQAEIKLGKMFSEDLKDPKSDAFIALKGEVEKTMDTIFKKEFGDSFNRTEVNSFSNGSVDVLFDTFFNDLLGFTTTDNNPSYDSLIVGAIVEAIEDGEVDDLDIQKDSVVVSKVEGGDTDNDDVDNSAEVTHESRSANHLKCFNCFASGLEKGKACLEEQTMDTNDGIETCRSALHKCWAIRWEHNGNFKNFTRKCMKDVCSEGEETDGEMCMYTEGNETIRQCTQCCTNNHCNYHSAAMVMQQSLFLALLVGILIQVMH